MSRPLESTIEDTVRSLQCAASVASFESSNECEFQAELTASLQEAAVASTQKDKPKQHSEWIYYNDSFEKVLYEGIPWAELLADYSRRKQHASSRREQSTLQHLILLLLNPCIIAHALGSSLCIVFFRVIVEDQSLKSVSENPLLHALRRLFETRPSTDASAWLTFIKTHFQIQPEKIALYNVERAHRVVSVCKHLSTVVNQTVLTKCLLTMMQILDDVDVRLLQTTIRKRRIESYSCSCNNTSQQFKKRRRMPAFDLDDDIFEHTDSSTLAVATVEVAGGAIVEKISRRRPHYQPECHLCRTRKSAEGITRLPIQLVMLRFRLYKRVVSTTSNNTQTMLENRQRATSLLSPVVYTACQYPESASMRLCILLLADNLSFRGYQAVVECIWSLYEQRGLVIGEAALRIYAEFLVESSHFDDSGAFWNALQPLMNRLREFCESKLATTVEVDAETNNRTRLALKSLAYILCRRRHVLSSMETHSKWQKLVSSLSMAFEGHDWWISRDMSEAERHETLATLQAVGILGLSLMDDLPLVEHGSVDELKTWPFTKARSIRGAHQRMGPGLAAGLLSNPSRRPPELPKPTPSRKCGTDECSTKVPIMDYLNDDLLQIVFSFLGYKRLVKASGVCKSWRSICASDLLWHQAYTARFTIWNAGASVDASLARNDFPRVNWKTLFANKVLAERALRFKRHSSGWRHRTCEHIGCLMVVRSPKQMTIHYQTHMKGKRKQQGKKRSHSKKKGKPNVKLCA